MTSAQIADILQSVRTVAVLGAHPDPDRAAFYVPEYLDEQGYRIVPVNATKTDLVLFGEPVRASLGDIDEPVDVVDIFRRAEALPGHLAEILAMDPRPRVVWMQLGIEHDAVARELEAEGITVIQDRCMLAEHRARGIGRVDGPTG